MDNEDEFKGEKCNDASLKLLTELDANSYRVTQRADQGAGNLHKQILNKSSKISFLLRRYHFYLCGGKVSNMSDKLLAFSFKWDPIRKKSLH